MLFLQENWSSKEGMPEEWKKKNPNRKPGGNPGNPIVLIPAHQFCAIIVGKRVIYHGNVEENDGIREGEETADMEAYRWQIWRNLWQRYKKF